MKELLAMLNVPVKHNKRTEEFVEKFIQEHGGSDKFNQEIQRQTTLPATKTILNNTTTTDPHPPCKHKANYKSPSVAPA